MQVPGDGATAEKRLWLYYGFSATGSAIESEMIKEFNSSCVMKQILVLLQILLS